MKKAESKAFMDFMTAEGMRYQRDITKPEILTWFETFPLVTLEDFKIAWEQHRTGKWGGRFPTTNDLLRLTKTAGIEAVARDWRCSEEINGERCGYPGGINAGKGAQCTAHYRIHGTERYSVEASLQIIEASRGYVPPKTVMEAMERGGEQRSIEGERWRKTHAREIEAIQPKRRPADAIAPTLPAKVDAEPPSFDEIPPPEGAYSAPLEELAP